MEHIGANFLSIGPEGSLSAEGKERGEGRRDGGTETFCRIQDKMNMVNIFHGEQAASMLIR
jgi:hypothetical protein